MVKRKTALTIRRIHRYLGIFIGIQFIMWTVSGLYFSWSDIDEIHGDQFKKEMHHMSFTGLVSPDSLNMTSGISTLDLKSIAHHPYYWINDSLLVDAKSGMLKEGITGEEAERIAADHMIEGLKIKSIERIETTDGHHEYRGKKLPAFMISYDQNDALRSYVSVQDGSFQTVRHRSWRWFDFLWMTHTMDYEGRDDFNNLLLRGFSLLGLLTVMSGFVLWYVSSPRIRRILK